MNLLLGRQQSGASQRCSEEAGTASKQRCQAGCPLGSDLLAPGGRTPGTKLCDSPGSISRPRWERLGRAFLPARRPRASVGRGLTFPTLWAPLGESWARPRRQSAAFSVLRRAARLPPTSPPSPGALSGWERRLGGEPPPLTKGPSLSQASGRGARGAGQFPGPRPGLEGSCGRRRRCAWAVGCASWLGARWPLGAR